MLAVDSRRTNPNYRQVYLLNSIAANTGENAANASATRLSYVDGIDGISTWPSEREEFVRKLVHEFNPMVSPDGANMLVISERMGRPDIMLWPASTPDTANLTQPTRLTASQPTCRYETPAWSPDGRMIYWVSDCNGHFDIYSAELRYTPTLSRDRHRLLLGFRAELTNIRNLTNNAANDRFARIAPDGTQIAFASDRDGNWEIYVMNIDGSNVRRLTNHPATDDAPTWSPDGRQLAFASDRDGDFEIYILNVSDGVMTQQVTQNTAQDRWPLWAQ